MDQLLGWCLPLLRARASGKLASYRRANADPSDIAQDVAVVAATKIGEFEGHNTRTFLGWLYGILDNRILQVIRPRGTRGGKGAGRSPLRPPPSLLRDVVDSETSVSSRLAHEEDIERLKKVVGWFRSEEVAVITMRLSEALSYDEIAANLGLTAAAARQRYRRAVRRVGEALKLSETMSRQGTIGLQQDVVGIHRFQGAGARLIANQFGLKEAIVSDWIAEGARLFGDATEQAP
jgi:RNA polymerase sigma-70 factor (ECF subfamily)